MTEPKSTRRRGAPLNNTNALKHGFYSKAFTQLENTRLDLGTEGEFKDEEHLLRVLIARTVESMQGTELSHEEIVVALRAISLAIGRIESLHRTRKVIYDKGTTLQAALDELKYLTLEED